MDNSRSHNPSSTAPSLSPPTGAAVSRRRIALAFPGCHRRAGVERILFECASFLGPRHDVTVYAHEWDEPPPADSFRYQFVPARRQPDFTYGLSFFRACSRMIDVSEFDGFGNFGCVAPLCGVPWVQSVHKAWLERSRQMRAARSWARARQKINPLHPVLLKLESKHFAERNYRKVVALTPEVRSDLERLYGVPHDDIVVIPNGFAPAEFNLETRTQREEVRAELGIPGNARVLVFVANEAERKGLEPLLNALAKLNRTDLHLLAVGRLPAATWAPIAENLGLGGRVHWTGPSAQVARYYAASDAFVLPTFYEPWGLVVVEAMACGLPVLTSKVAGAAEAVREGVTGELLDNAKSVDEIAERLEVLLHGNYAPAAEIAASVEAYAWPRVLQRYEDVLLNS